MKPLYLIGMLSIIACASNEKNNEKEPGTEINGVLITGEEDIRDEESDTAREDAECEERASAAVEDCLANGGSDADCELVYTETYRECMGEDAGAGDGDDNANEACERAGEDAMQDCYDNGGSDDECRIAYAEAYAECEENQ